MGMVVVRPSDSSISNTRYDIVVAGSCYASLKRLQAQLELRGLHNKVAIICTGSSDPAPDLASHASLIILHGPPSHFAGGIEIDHYVHHHVPRLIITDERPGSGKPDDVVLPENYEVKDLIEAVGRYVSLPEPAGSPNRLESRHGASPVDTLYQDLFERSSDAILLIDRNTHIIIDANDQAELLYGHDRAEFVGMYMLQIVDSDEHITIWEATKNMSAGDFPVTRTVQRHHLRKNGSSLTVEISASLLRLGQYTVFQDVIRDVTQREREREALANSEARFKSLVSLSSDWYWEQDENFRFKEFSDSMQHLAGSSAASHIGKTRWELPIVDMGEEDWTKHIAVLKRFEPFYDFEYKRISEQGDIVWVSSSGMPIFNGDGIFHGYRGISRNVTERKRRDLALRESQSRLQALFDHAPMAIVFKDAVGRYQWFNRHIAELMGIEASEAIGKLPHDVAPPHMAASFAAHDKKVYETVKPHEQKDVWATPRGDRTYLNVKFPVQDSDGNLIGIGAVGRDISELEQTEAALRESEERLSVANATLEARVAERTLQLETETARHIETQAAALSERDELIASLRAAQASADQLGQIIEESVSEVYVVDHQTYRIMSANRSARQALGYTSDEFLELRPWDFVEHINPETVDQIMEPLRSGAVPDQEIKTTHRRKDGSTYPVRAHLQYMKDHSPPVYVAVVQDISEQTKVEQRFEELLESAPDAIIIAGQDGAIEIVNAQTEALFGYQRSQLIGQPIEMLIPDRFSDSYPKHRRRYFKDPRARPMGLGPQLYGRRKDGSEFPVEISLSAVAAQDQELVSAAIRDVSLQRETEEQLRQSQRLDTVGKLTGGIAHDFNNILTVMQLNLGLLDRETPPTNYRVLVEESRSAAELAADLIKRLTIFSRDHPLVPEVVNLNDLVRDSAQILQRTLGDRIEIQTALDPDLSMTVVDPVMMQNAVINLALNARDAIPEQGTVTITTAHSTLTGNATEEHNLEHGRYVVISVRDDGVGMPQEVLERAVEPFFTTKDVGQGTGLGLSTIHGFATQSGGCLALHSTIGDGTTAAMYLPVSSESADTERTSSVNGPIRGGTETILVVEDDPQVRVATVRLLRDLGYNICQASDGPQAIEIVSRSPEIKLVLTDITMPGGLTGPATARKIERGRPDLKFVFMTGYAADNAAIEPGQIVLRKPLSATSLDQAIREVLDR